MSKSKKKKKDKENKESYHKYHTTIKKEHLIPTKPRPPENQITKLEDVGSIERLVRTIRNTVIVLLTIIIIILLIIRLK